MKAMLLQHNDQAIDYIPTADVEAGEVVIVNGRVGITLQRIAAGKLGAVALRGLFKVQKANVAVTDGAQVYWAAAGDPVNGTAGTGAATTGTAGNQFIGRAAKAAAASDETVFVVLNLH